MSADSPITMQTAAQVRSQLIRIAIADEAYGKEYVTSAIDRLLLAGVVDTDAVLAVFDSGLEQIQSAPLGGDYE